MSQQTLDILISEKGFDNYLNNLSAKCTASNIDFLNKYSTDGSALTVWLNFGNIPTIIHIDKDGSLSYTYYQGGIKKAEHFINCTDADFRTMLERAFIYLQDGNPAAHQEWYDSLQKK
jgi:hypothetical protein